MNGNDYKDSSKTPTFLDRESNVELITLKLKVHDYYDYATNRDCAMVDYEGPYRADLVGAIIKRFIDPVKNEVIADD